MKKIMICAFLGLMAMPSMAWAQDGNNTAPISFELDEEKLTIEADIPSVDLILSFREIQERSSSMKASFLDEIVKSAKEEPF